MFTPTKYWRIACDLDGSSEQPPSTFMLPAALANQSSPPTNGHGLAIAAFDPSDNMGIFTWVGIITGRAGVMRDVDWRATTARIWIDTPNGRRYWAGGAFGFAPSKNSDYELHQLWSDHFEELRRRESGTVAGDSEPSKTPSHLKISPERLNPIEVIGEPTNGEKAGVVYLLKSAYGYKVGRTRNVPARMRAFGVHLPFIYTIPLCSWFADCHAAERRYHKMFVGKRINGEWFDLDENDIEKIRLRA